MEQRDYLLREIEKIGKMLAMMLSKMIAIRDSEITKTEKLFETEKEMLLSEIGFDTEFFLSLEKAQIEPYISGLKGFNAANIELLADLLHELGMMYERTMISEYLQKALDLYERTTALDQPFSEDRFGKITSIKKELSC